MRIALYVERHGDQNIADNRSDNTYQRRPLSKARLRRLDVHCGEVRCPQDDDLDCGDDEGADRCVKVEG